MVDLTDRVKALRDGVVEVMERQARASQFDGIQKQLQVLKEISEIEQRIKIIEEELAIVEKKINKKNIDRSDKLMINENSMKKKASKEKARMNRKHFVERLKGEGIDLEKYRGQTIYKTIKNDIVGIAYSSLNGDRWFLGLPIMEYKTIVLMCEDENEKPMTLFIGQKIIVKIKEYLSRDNKNENYKFNVYQDEDGFYLILKNSEKVYLEKVQSGFLKYF